MICPFSGQSLETEVALGMFLRFWNYGTHRTIFQVNQQDQGHSRLLAAKGVGLYTSPVEKEVVTYLVFQYQSSVRSDDRFPPTVAACLLFQTHPELSVQS